VSPADEFAGHFVARSPYGFLKATHGEAVAPRFHVEKETLALIEGDVKAKTTEASATATATIATAGIAGTHEEVVSKSVSLDALYGRVEFFVPDPEHKSHSEKKSHH